MIPSVREPGMGARSGSRMPGVAPPVRGWPARARLSGWRIYPVAPRGCPPGDYSGMARGLLRAAPSGTSSGFPPGTIPGWPGDYSGMARGLFRDGPGTSSGFPLGDCFGVPPRGLLRGSPSGTIPGWPGDYSGMAPEPDRNGPPGEEASRRVKMSRSSPGR